MFVFFFFFATLGVAQVVGVDQEVVKSAILDSTPAVEFTGGGAYRNTRLTVELPHSISLVGHHFGAMEGEVGAIGLVRRWEVKKGLTAYMGGGPMFGRHEPVGPGLIFGSDFKKPLSEGKNKIVAKIIAVQAVRPSEDRERDSYVQLSLGLEFGHWTLQGQAERFHHRKEREWSWAPALYRAFGRTGVYVGIAPYFSPGHGAHPAVVGTIGFDPALRRE